MEPMRPYDTFLHLFLQAREAGAFPFRFTFPFPVEATNHCNPSCTMCPRETAGRGYGHMDFDLFAKLARQAAHRDTLFSPQGHGEPFLHPRYPEMRQVLHDAGVRCPIVITNGTFLDAADPAVFGEPHEPCALCLSSQSRPRGRKPGTSTLPLRSMGAATCAHTTLAVHGNRSALDPQP